MVIRSFKRGWPIIYIDSRWVYEDTGEPVTSEPACCRCGQRPTVEGYDACIGHVKDSVSACCGHGVELPYTLT